MPELSRFFGIVITMFYNDHSPPHFHAKYAEDRAVIRIDDLAVLRGEIPARALALIVEWASLHRDDLLENWELARQQFPLRPIEPLR
jgi:hypothetical protein